VVEKASMPRGGGGCDQKTPQGRAQAQTSKEEKKMIPEKEPSGELAENPRREPRKRKGACTKRTVRKNVAVRQRLSWAMKEEPACAQREYAIITRLKGGTAEHGSATDERAGSFIGQQLSTLLRRRREASLQKRTLGQEKRENKKSLRVPRGRGGTVALSFCAEPAIQERGEREKEPGSSVLEKNAGAPASRFVI